MTRMNWEEIKTAVQAFIEQLGQALGQQPEQALKPIPIEQQAPRHPRRR